MVEQSPRSSIEATPTGEPVAGSSHPSRRPPRSNLTVRLLTAAVMVPFLLWLLYWAPVWAFMSFVFLAVAVASYELMEMTVGASRFLRSLGVCTTLGLTLVFCEVNDARLVLTSVLGVTIIGLLGGLLFPEPIAGAGLRTGWLIAGPLYVGGTLSTLILLHREPSGGSWIVLAMMLSWFGDTGGYFAGRAWGRHKLYPKVSPKKTVEGSVGSLAGSAVGALSAHFGYLPELPLLDALALAAAASFLGQAGDLCESLIKRSTGVKDSGQIVPGHGGLLDRIDALMFTSVATWVYVSYVA